MSITIDGKTKRIGLALSGGGFRAAAFHLGVFRKLEQLELLKKLDLLTCVSGGSIAGGFLAAHWNDPEVLPKLENYLRTKSIAVGSFLEGMFNPFETRLEALAETYDDHLFDGKTLDDLQNGPRIYFNSTNLATGNMFTFVAGGNGLSEKGEWKLGFQPANDFPLSKAVAASSAFPPVFPPLRLTQKDYSHEDVDFITLSDGGVYDNLGINPLLVDINSLDYALVSDGGKPFSIDRSPTEAGSKVLIEAIGILMEQVRGLQFKRLLLSYEAEKGPKPVWFSIDSHVNNGQDEYDAIFASSISTNLKKFNKKEMRVLTRHGSNLLEARIRKYMPELFY